MKKIGLALILAMLIACQAQQQGTTVETKSGTYDELVFDLDEPVNTNRFQSVEEFEAFVRSHEGGSYYGGIAFDSMARTMVAESAQAAPTAVPGIVGMDSSMGMAIEESARDIDYSETNVQVKGIDEADIIKTDGEYIYTITGENLFIIRAYPGEDAEVLETMKLESQPSGLFIAGETLAIMGNYQDDDFFREIDFTPRQGMSFLHVYDVSNKEDPELLKEYKFEGGYFEARMAGGHVYLVTQNRPTIRPGPWPMPIIVEGTSVREMPVSDIYYYDILYNNPQLIHVHAMDLGTLDVNSKSVMVEGSQNMYMSHKSMYVTYTENVNEWQLTQEIMRALLEPFITDSDRNIIEKIKQTDNDVLTQREKEQKILQIYMSYLEYMDPEERDDLEDEAEELLMEKLEEYEYFEHTIINKIDYADGEIEVAENGKVPGHVNNQFSMDEQDGVLRIATTVSARWSQFEKDRTESINNIYTLDEDLEILDGLEGLAEGEQIFSTRFMGNRLYMVTFEQVDPFFVIDLSNPGNIRNLGELKITGFSRYLHPYDSDTIIGLGQEATETGRTTGLKISLFDVSDVENPEEIAKFVTDERYAQSTALYEHHAFLFSREKNLLVIPAYSSDYRGNEAYNGAFVFHIDRDEIDLRGLIDHSQGAQQWYSPQMERSLYIEELLYTKSPGLLRINELDDLESVKNITLKATSTDIPVY